jgi:hypothetical protein
MLKTHKNFVKVSKKQLVYLLSFVVPVDMGHKSVLYFESHVKLYFLGRGLMTGA